MKLVEHIIVTQLNAALRLCNLTMGGFLKSKLFDLMAQIQERCARSAAYC